MDVDEDTSDRGRDDLVHPHGGSGQDHECARATDEAEEDEHGDVHRSCEERSRYNGDDRGHGDGHLATLFVGQEGDVEDCEESASLVEAVHRRDELVRIARGIGASEIEIS